jgi:hypothetical protein
MIDDNRVLVKVIGERGRAALVEFDGEQGRSRVYVPGDSVHAGMVDAETLAQGIEYGVPWEAADIRVTPELVAAELRRRGIWTLEDLQAKPNEAIAAVMQAAGASLAALRRVAKQYSGGKT